MKKIFILLATLALLSLTACISKDATEKLQENFSSDKKVVTIYSSETGLLDGNYQHDEGTKSVITTVPLDGYTNVFKIEHGTGWGSPPAPVAGIALGGMGKGYTLKYESVTFKAKLEELNNKNEVEVRIGGIRDKKYDKSNATFAKSLGNDWYEFKIPFSQYDGMSSDAETIIILGGFDNPGTLYITDVILTEK